MVDQRSQDVYADYDESVGDLLVLLFLLPFACCWHDVKIIILRISIAPDDVWDMSYGFDPEVSARSSLQGRAFIEMIRRIDVFNYQL